MNRQRLERLAKVLESVEETKFDMNWWARTYEHCGATCCAFGHAALDPELRSQGLELRVRKIGGGSDVMASISDLEEAASKPGYSHVVLCFPRGDGTEAREIEAAIEFFDIPEEAALNLFCPSRYAYGKQVRPRDVIGRINRLLQKEGKE